MTKLLHYIQENKSFLLIFLGIFLTFGLYNTISYCMPGILLHAITYFSGISPEFYANKAIDTFIYYSPIIFNKTIEYAPTITFYTGVITLCSIGGLGLLYTGEVIYNRNYFINKYLESTPIIGHALKGYKYLFIKEQSNPQYVYVVKDLINYIGLLPKPKVEIREVEKIVTQTIEKPVVSFRDRPQLRFLHNKMDQIEHSVLFINDNSNFSNLIMQEMINLSRISNQLIREDCEFTAKNQDLPDYLSNISKIGLKYFNVTQPVRPSIGTFIRLVQNPGRTMLDIMEEPRFETGLFAIYDEHSYVRLDLEFFKTNYPKIYLLLNDKMRTLRAHALQETCVSLNVGYTNTGRGLLSVSKIDPNAFTLEYLENDDLVRKPILSEIEAYFDISMRTEKESLQQLISEVRGFILNNTNSEIDVYLERRLQADTLINKSKDLMELELYIKAKRERPISYREPETLVAPEPIREPVVNETLEVINPISTLVQNPLMMFAMALSTFVTYDFHNIELAANTLLGFATIHGWDNTFLEFSRMSIADLQSTYNFTQAGAEKAREIIDYAYDLRYPASSESASSYNTIGQLPWNKIMYVGGVFLLGAGLTWLYFKSIQNGTSAESAAPIINNLNPNVNDWSAYVLSEIDKL